MRIISQDGNKDFPYDRCTIWILDNQIIASPVGEPETDGVMATYSTREKAEKAMQKLHEFYMGVFVLNDAPNTEESIDKLQNLNQSFFSLQPYKKESSIEIVGNSVFWFPEEEEL